MFSEKDPRREKWNDVSLGCSEEKVTLGMRNGSDPSLGCFQRKTLGVRNGMT